MMAFRVSPTTRQVVLHATVLPCAVVLATLWANQLLHVARKTATVTVSEEVLEQLADERSTSDPTGGPPSTAEPTEPTKPTDPAEVNSDAGKVARTTDLPNHSRDAREAAVAARQDDNAEAPREGRNLSLDGHGVTSDPALSDRDGRQSPVWDASPAAGVTPDRLEQLNLGQLVLVRRRRGYTEVAVIRNKLVRSPVHLKVFCKRHPAFGKRGVVYLPKSWLRRFSEQLLKYGGGWEVSLLVADSLYDQWQLDARRFIQQRGIPWEQAARLTAKLSLKPSQRGGVEPRLQFVAVDRRRPTADADQNATGNGTVR